MRSFSKKRLMRRNVNFTINKKPKPNEIVSSTRGIAVNQSSFSFSSLPTDVVLNCLARVPRCYYPNLSCVSKSFRSLVRSPQLAYMRSIKDKNVPILYICYTEPTCTGRNLHWFSYDPHEKKTSTLLNSIPLLSQQKLCCSIVSIGSTIYFIGGSMITASPRIRVFNPWSGELCEGPSMKVARMLPGVAVVDGKLYVIGGCLKDQIQVEVFDPKTQTWEVGPFSPHEGIQHVGRSYMPYTIIDESVAVEGKVYGISDLHGRYIIYDTKDGRCDTFEMADDDAWWRGGVCVINNVLYVYYTTRGLMWYDSIDKVWRVVHRLKLDKRIDMPVGMVDCNGKLAFLWEDRSGIISQRTRKKIWCTLIALDRCGLAISGTVKWSGLVGSFPIYYDVWRCLNVSD